MQVFHNHIGDMTLIIHIVAILCAILRTVPLVHCLSVDVSPQQVTVHKDDSITIKCTADHVTTAYDSRINFTWFHDSNAIAVERAVADSDKYFISMDGETSSILRVASINPDDRGAYTCMAVEEGTSNTARSSADITVWYPPAVHFPKCFTQDLSQNVDTGVPEGTSVTFVCSSNSANPMPTISWFRSDTMRSKYVGGTIVPGDNFLRNEITMFVDETFQGASFECHLQSPAFPSFDQSCSIGPIVVLTSSSSSGNNDPNTKHGADPTVISAGLFPTDPASPNGDGPDHGNKNAADATRSPTSPIPSPSFCARTPSFADRALVPVSVILTIVLIILVVVIILQMWKIALLSSKPPSSSPSGVVGVRHDALKDECYMAISRENSREPYTELKMRAGASVESSGVSEYEYDMPGIYNTASSGSAAVSEHPPLENKISEMSYEDMTDPSPIPGSAPQSRPVSQDGNSTTGFVTATRDSPGAGNSPVLNHQQDRPISCYMTRIDSSPKRSSPKMGSPKMGSPKMGSPKIGERPPTPPRTRTLDKLCKDRHPIAPHRTRTEERPNFGGSTDRKMSAPEPTTLQYRPTLQARSLSHNAHELARELQQATPLPPIPQTHMYECTITGMSVH